MSYTGLHCFPRINPFLGRELAASTAGAWLHRRRAFERHDSGPAFVLVVAPAPRPRTKAEAIRPCCDNGQALRRGQTYRAGCQPAANRARPLVARTIDDPVAVPLCQAPKRSGRCEAAAGVAVHPSGRGSLLGGPPRCKGNGATALATSGSTETP